MTTQTIAGIAIPDTPLVRDTTEYIRDVEDDLLFDHSRRVFLFGALECRRRGLEPDLEQLYVGAMFHDIGLTADYRDSMLRFEVDGANAAEKFLRDRGTDDAAVRKVWLSIALHTTPGVPEFLDPEIALVTAGVETDVLGIGRGDLTDDVRNAVTAAHPRPSPSLPPPPPPAPPPPAPRHATPRLPPHPGLCLAWLLRPFALFFLDF